MESGEVSSRPCVGFPLGIALLVIFLLCMSGFFTCCYHWGKLRALLLSSVHVTDDPEADTAPSPRNSIPPFMKSKQNQGQSFTVLMPGDQLPKFVAMPCPCESTHVEKIIVKVQKQPPLPLPLYPCIN